MVLIIQGLPCVGKLVSCTLAFIPACQLYSSVLSDWLCLFLCDMPICLQAHGHCRHLEQVLDDLASKTELSCFPVIVGSRPPSAIISPPESTRSRGNTSDDKENRSPSSIQSFRSPQNIIAQVFLFEFCIYKILLA